MRRYHAYRFISNHPPHGRVADTKMHGKFLKGHQLGLFNWVPREGSKTTPLGKRIASRADIGLAIDQQEERVIRILQKFCNFVQQ